jgi:rhodanese-related sulfurtransferase/predicted metal-dependent enzyme (double-stranded beta helix superfamily)
MSEVLDEVSKTVQLNTENLINPQPKPPGELAAIVASFAASGQWVERVRLRTDRRWYERLYVDSDYDIWMISWLPGQSTGFHDHGESCGAFVVASGILEEHRPDHEAKVFHPGNAHSFGPDYAHDVRNESYGPAISIHAYSPPLSEMNEYEFDGGRLIPRERASVLSNDFDESGGERRLGCEAEPLTIDKMLAAARQRLRRLSPHEALEASRNSSALLVDIRPERQRTIEGTIENALVIERNVLEWRFDPLSSSRLPLASSHDLHVIVFCSEGYTSSLAAAALQDLGLWRATDITGGLQAWKASGLPIVWSTIGI